MTDQITSEIFTLPSLGESVREGTVTRWLVSEGASIADGDPLLEVATDKVDTEVPSSFTGILVRVLAHEDDVVVVGGELALFQRVNTDISDQSGEFRTLTTESAPPPTKRESIGGLPAERNPNPNEFEPRTGIVPIHELAATAVASSTQSSAPGDRVEKLSPIRKVIGQRMMNSLDSTAQLTSVVEVDVTRIASVRAHYKATGRRISYLPFFVKATIETLAAHPVFNTTVSESGTEITYHSALNIGIAVDSPKGLMFPVIKDAATLSVDAISDAIEQLAVRLRTGGITTSDLDGGTFTMTNAGNRGALFDTPILNYPQTAILGSGAVVQRVVPLPGDGVQIGVRSVAYFALTYDHRIVDGADAARFLADLKAIIEAGPQAEASK